MNVHKRRKMVEIDTYEHIFKSIGHYIQTYESVVE
jgi:hypothetical protein